MLFYISYIATGGHARFIHWDFWLLESRYRHLIPIPNPNANVKPTTNPNP